MGGTTRRCRLSVNCCELLSGSQRAAGRCRQAHRAKACQNFTVRVTEDEAALCTPRLFESVTK